MGRKQEGTCKEPGCDEQVAIRGYCRYHYDQRRKIRERLPNLSVSQYEHYLALTRELSRADTMYKVVRRIEDRVHWRREMDSINGEMAKLNRIGLPKYKKKVRRAGQWKKNESMTSTPRKRVRRKK